MSAFYLSDANDSSDDVESVSSDFNEKSEFDALVRGINDVLGTSSGIDSDDVEVEDLIRLMQSYESDPNHWAEYALEDRSRNYTRNLVDEGNGKANLLILVWTPGKGSLIHDHANAHCIMKILKGSLEEHQYDWPDKKLTEKGQPCPLEVKKCTRYTENTVAYISDKIGLHRISNPDPENVAISLHLYTPPYAAKFGCSKFDEKTGKAVRMQLCDYYSAYGKRGLASGHSV